MTETDSPAIPNAAERSVPPTPWTWRASIAAAVVLIATAAYAARDVIGPRGQAVAGLFCFFGLVATFSSNLRAVNWRTIGWGIVIQIVLAVLVLKVPLVHEALQQVKGVVVHFIDFSNAGAQFVFATSAHEREL